MSFFFNRKNLLPMLFFLTVFAVVPSYVFGIEDSFLKMDRVVETPDGVMYGTARSFGFLVSCDGGRNWKPLNNGLPEKIVYPFEKNEIETLTSLGFDPVEPERLVCTTAFGLFIREPEATAWKQIPITGPVRSANYITSASISSVDRSRILISTSFSGIFETEDGGRSWSEVAGKSLKYRGAGFNEEIASAVYDPADDRSIYLAYSFGNGLYRYSSASDRWQALSLPEWADKSIQNIYFRSGLLMVEVRDALLSYDPGNRSWLLVHNSEPVLPGPARSVRLERAADKKGMYVGPSHASGSRLISHLDFAERNGLDSIVIDIKDDYGFLTYETSLDMPHEVNAVKKRMDIKELIRQAHSRGIYVIGRVVVFKDRQLFNYDGYKYALWDKHSDDPWRYLIKSTDSSTGEVSYEQREFWVDPFSEDVWKYNADIAYELQTLGIDEIQFDYIRFPSDGDTSRIRYRNMKPGQSRINALESFFRVVRERVHIPLSTDLYGFNSYYRMGNWIGQNIEMLADYVDVICPMYYPSHFPRTFMKELSYLDRAEEIYYEGSIRASEIVRSRSIIRPYVQAFLLPAEYYMEEDEYKDYLVRQLNGCRRAGASGYLLWNMSNRYYMVSEPLEVPSEG